VVEIVLNKGIGEVEGVKDLEGDPGALRKSGGGGDDPVHFPEGAGPSHEPANRRCHRADASDPPRQVG
jgi:hypothetical protein